ncbi:TonB-dependent receptor [Carboxylicivirga linearis]|uniref:TonB-dependent receptor n=1 Tax=Carboxylicivirga linearis TaxID=1628157 RepID=A0ABS5K408_9BACT|nr:TonB-dependent receptor [Carboxylicivirga linearis]MBS2101236.1 TonB-dependent receptor [Carboxylicivirga linearis]
MKYIISTILFIASSGILIAQNSVTFKVKEESGEALIGASIAIEGTTKGTITNTEGIAKFDNLSDGKYEFVISFIGYEEAEIELSFPESNQKTIEIELEEGEELEEVVIAATRSSRTIQDIPTRIEAITGEELGEKAAMNSSNIGMLLRETTGVQMQQTSLSSGNMSIRIQGLDGRYTQILKDGMPLYGGFAGGLSIMQIPPLDLKQVELIKGSNSTLYGGGAIAGLVNLVTIKPADKPKLDIMLNQTSALGTTGNLFYAQKYGKLGLSVYGSANNQVAYDPDDDGFSNMPEAKTFSLNPKLYYYLNKNTELSVGFMTTFDDRTGGDMKMIEGNPGIENVFTEKNKSERYATQLNFQNHKENRTISLKNSISYFNRELTIPEYNFNGNQISSFTETMYSLHKSKKTDWQFGANHYLEQFTEDNTDTLPTRDYTHNTVGGFVQNITDLNEKFILESGLRTDYNTDYGVFILPRFSLLYKANNKLSSRIGGAMGYKLPTIFTEDAERLYFRGIQPLSNEQVDAETSIGGNFDINYKTALGDEMTFSINQLFFLTQLKNALVLREDETANLAYFESADGNILSSGFETNIKLTYDDFNLYLNYAFVNTELKYDNINKQKPLTPKHNAGFVLMYEIEEKWSAGYELYYTGHQYDNAYNKKSDYWMMGVMLMRMFEKFSVFINFENFTNTHQAQFEPLVLPPTNNPTFTDIWAPTDGFVFNGGIKFSLF